MISQESLVLYKTLFLIPLSIHKVLLNLRMSKFLRLIILSTIIFSAVSCKKNGFQMDFSLPENLSANYNVTYYASGKNGGITVQAVASVQAGVCQLMGATYNPTLVYVWERKQIFPLVIYVERGQKIKISGETGSPLDWDVAGNDINGELTSWRLENAEILVKGDEEQINRAVEEYVRSNPSSPASTLILLCYFTRNNNESLYSELFASLRGEAKNDRWISMVGRSDQLSTNSSYPARLYSMVMRSAEDGADTLRFCHHGPTLIFFWNNGMNERKEIFDSVKVLLKETPDTLRRTIADICVDSDSISWRGPLKKDSVDGLVRLWAPLSLAEPDLIKLKVNAIPYYIVFDSLGYQSYRGTDLDSAIIDFRRLYNRADSLK